MIQLLSFKAQGKIWWPWRDRKHIGEALYCYETNMVVETEIKVVMAVSQ